MFGRIVAAYEWLIEGLVDALSALLGTLNKRQRLRLIRDGGDFALDRPAGGRATLQLQPGPDGAFQFDPQSARELIEGQDVDLVLHPDEVLVRNLDPLPAESAPYLDGVVRHHIDRLIPWRAEDVLHAFKAAPAGPNDPRLAVTLVATARSLHARVLDALQALKPRSLRLLYLDPGVDGDTVAIPIDGNGFESGRRVRLRRAVLAGLAVLLLAELAGAAMISLAWRNADDTIEAVASEIAERRRNLPAQAQGPVTGRDVDAMLTRKRTTPIVVLALDALSTALPDDTWLSEMRVAEQRVRIIGISRNVAALVPLIEAAPAFAEPSFFAPTTRLPEGQGDRFHLEARLIPPTKSTP